MKIILIIILLIITGCFHSKDYYTSDDYKIKMRQKSSLKMYEETHQVRNKLSKKRKVRSKRKKRYYS